MKYLGIDFGTKRIGLALSDEEGRVAFPKMVLENDREALSKVARYIEQNVVGQVVLGESKDFSGADNPVQEDIEQFKKDLEELTGKSVVYEREYFTSALAARQFAPKEKSRKPNPEHKNLDASAAALILQSFLDKLKH